jgi:uncharacterized membrane protein
MHAIAAAALAAFLLAAGAAHFAFPAYFRSLVPPWLGRAGAIVAVSGAAEIAVGTLLLAPPTRAAGGWAAAALITAYLPTHLDALRRARPDRPRWLDRPFAGYVRLVANLGYIAWAAAVALTAA